jgi:hypothetical protein
MRSWSEMLLMQIRMLLGSGGAKCADRKFTRKEGCFGRGREDVVSSISKETKLDSIRRLLIGSNSSTLARYLPGLPMSNRSPSRIICSALLPGGISIVETVSRKREKLQLGSGRLGGGDTSPAASKTSTPGEEFIWRGVGWVIEGPSERMATVVLNNNIEWRPPADGQAGSRGARHNGDPRLRS